ncbi:DNA replication protein psf2 [Arachnomyces sp. PD_36]|nr:DNA replication protein psf2 [Arachnomyces sp. PD_36]
MEMVTVIPRQRLEGLELLGGPTQPLQPPRRTPLPLWLALLLKRQRRANILPPSWLHPDPLSTILNLETNHADFKDVFTPPPPLVPNNNSSRGGRGRGRGGGTDLPTRTLDGKKYFASPPFLPQNTADENSSMNRITTGGNNDPFADDYGSSSTGDVIHALPYHWLEVGTLLLEAASDDLVEPDQIRILLRDLREARMAKMRRGVDVLDAEVIGGGVGGVAMTGVGAMEVGEGRGFVSGVAEELRKIGASKEQARLEREAEERERGQGYDSDDNGSDDMEM